MTGISRIIGFCLIDKSVSIPFSYAFRTSSFESLPRLVKDESGTGSDAFWDASTAEVETVERGLRHERDWGSNPTSKFDGEDAEPRSLSSSNVVSVDGGVEEEEEEEEEEDEREEVEDDRDDDADDEEDEEEDEDDDDDSFSSLESR